MAIDPATAKLIAKAVISQITDEEKRQRLIIGIVVGVVVFILILATPMLLITSAWDKIKNYFGWETEEEMTSSPEYSTIYQMKTVYGYNLETGNLTFNGELPMPLENATVTSEYGNRIHPVTRQTVVSHRNRFGRRMAHKYNECIRWDSSICRSTWRIWKLC